MGVFDNKKFDKYLTGGSSGAAAQGTANLGTQTPVQSPVSSPTATLPSAPASQSPFSHGFLSAVPGIIGGIGGGIAGGALGNIPGAIAGSAAGMGLGEAVRQRLAGEQVQPGRIGHEAIVGGALEAGTAGLGIIAKPLFKGGISAAKNVAESTFSQFFKPGAGEIKTALHSGGEFDVVTKMIKEGLPLAPSSIPKVERGLVKSSFALDNYLGKINEVRGGNINTVEQIAAPLLNLAKDAEKLGIPSEAQDVIFENLKRIGAIEEVNPTEVAGAKKFLQDVMGGSIQGARKTSVIPSPITGFAEATPNAIHAGMDFGGVANINPGAMELGAGQIQRSGVIHPEILSRMKGIQSGLMREGFSAQPMGVGSVDRGILAGQASKLPAGVLDSAKRLAGPSISLGGRVGVLTGSKATVRPIVTNTVKKDLWETIGNMFANADKAAMRTGAPTFRGSAADKAIQSAGGQVREALRPVIGARGNALIDTQRYYILARQHIESSFKATLKKNSNFRTLIGGFLGSMAGGPIGGAVGLGGTYLGQKIASNAAIMTKAGIALDRAAGLTEELGAKMKLGMVGKAALYSVLKEIEQTISNESNVQNKQ